MVTAMEDACPNGVREEAEMTPPGQPGMEGPLAMLSTQEPDTAGGEERRRKRCHIFRWTERHCSLWSGFNFDDELEGLMEGFYDKKKKNQMAVLILR